MGRVMNKRKNFKMNALCALLGLFLLALPGCQLALESAGSPEEARLIGVFITTEHLDLFDHTQVDHVPIRQGQVDFSELFRPGRLYAEWCVEFRFPGVEGIPFFTATSPPVDDVHTEGVITTHGGRGIVGHGSHVAFGDNSVSIEKEGTVYAIPGAQALSTVHINPVYQTTDGRVFLVSGNSFAFHGNATEGRVFSTNLTETTTITENGVETTNSMSVTVNLAAMFPPESIVILQMNADSNVIMRTTFAPDEMPGMFRPEAQTEYVIVETHRIIPPMAYGDIVIRELIARQDHGIPTYMAREDGILEPNWTEIIWPDFS